MRADVLGEVPNFDAALLVAADELALVRVDDDLVDGRLVVVVALDVARPRVPDLERVVLRRGDEPLALAVKCQRGDVGCVTLERGDLDEESKALAALSWEGERSTNGRCVGRILDVVKPTARGNRGSV